MLATVWSTHSRISCEGWAVRVAAVPSLDVELDIVFGVALTIAGVEDGLPLCGLLGFGSLAALRDPSAPHDRPRHRPQVAYLPAHPREPIPPPPAHSGETANALDLASSMRNRAASPDGRCDPQSRCSRPQGSAPDPQSDTDAHPHGTERIRNKPLAVNAARRR